MGGQKSREATAGVVDLASDGEEERGLPPTFRAPAAPANRLDPPEFDEDDDELRAALNASLHTGRASNSVMPPTAIQGHKFAQLALIIGRVHTSVEPES